MQKLIFNIICVALMSSLSAQDVQNVSLSAADQNKLDKDVANYRQLTLEKNFEGLINYVLPYLVNLTGKDFMLEQFEKLNQNPETTFLDLKFTMPGKCMQEENKKICIIDYVSHFKMKFTQQKGQEDQEFDDYLRTMLGIYKNGKFKNADVHLDESDQSIDIKSSKTLLAIDKPEFNSWKFIEYNPQMISIYNAAIGENLSSELKNLKP